MLTKLARLLPYFIVSSVVRKFSGCITRFENVHARKMGNGEWLVVDRKSEERYNEKQRTKRERRAYRKYKKISAKMNEDILLYEMVKNEIDEILQDIEREEEERLYRD